MAVDGLSLMAFLDEREACRYQSERCIGDDMSNGAMQARWREAKQRVGPVNPRAGRPEIDRIPDQFAEHEAKVRETPGFSELAETFGEPQFAVVEIGPLLAYQMHVETDRANALCARVEAGEPSLGTLMDICLPLTEDPYVPQTSVTPNAVVIRSESLNLRIVKSGLFDNPDNLYLIGGTLLRMTCPLLHVAIYKGRAYLRNGFHRVYALQRAGATRLPCLIVETDLFENTGAIGGGETFNRNVLESDGAPTCAHYTDDRAYPVKLRRLSKIIHVNWTETIFVES